jgi:hypothetical protein
VKKRWCNPFESLWREKQNLKEWPDALHLFNFSNSKVMIFSFTYCSFESLYLCLARHLLLLHPMKNLFLLCFTAIKCSSHQSQCLKLYQVWLWRSIVETFVNSWKRWVFALISIRFACCVSETFKIPGSKSGSSFVHRHYTISQKALGECKFVKWGEGGLSGNFFLDQKKKRKKKW